MGLSATLGALAFQALNPPESSPVQDPTVDPSNPLPSLAGAFEVVNGLGDTITEASLLGKYTLLYFGFTHCPDICPAELAKMSAVLAMLDLIDPKLSATIQPVFASVDPSRDTPSVMSAYLKEFHPRFAAWTGSEAQIASLRRAYKVYVRAISDSERVSGDYVLDHSIFIYLIAPSGKCVKLFNSDSSVRDIANAIYEHAMQSRSEDARI